ncbi:MAG: FlxA-like family protein [Methyloceanibacter sp.]
MSKFDGNRVLHCISTGFMLCITQPVLAQSSSDLEQQIKAIQAQLQSIPALQAQLQSIQKQLTAQQAATKQVQAEVKNVPGMAAVNQPPGVQYVEVAPNGGVKIGPVTVKLGGFIDGSMIFRTRNEASDIGSSFAQIPFNQVPSAHEAEYRQSARNSRLSLLAETSWNEDTLLSAYVETDFKGVGVTTTGGQNNSYLPALRQAYLTVDKTVNHTDGWRFEVGQAWSLVTGFKDGLVPRDENIPLTIDTQYVPGFSSRRDPQLRITKVFSPEFSVALSAESPEANFAGDAPGAAQGVDELVTSTPGTGNSGGTLNSGQCVKGGGTAPTVVTTNCANYSVNVAPDMVLKAAFDPGWGHYEVFGLGRVFQTRTGIFSGTPGESQISGNNNTTFGGGAGGNLILPVIPKFLDFQASVLGGYGIGMYGAAQFADFTVNQDGEPKPIPEIQTLLGVVAHPTPRLDLYGYAGYEQAYRDTFDDGKRIFGYGSPLDTNAGCNIEGSAVFTTPLACAGQNKDVWQLTGGLWDRVYQSKAGTVAVGLQYSYTERQLFEGIGGSPTAVDNMVFASVRYYPF